jgi:mRNA-degrading endonuclease toxin of MazEF toxin-antitoxin module
VKNFDGWNKVKKHIDKSNASKTLKEGQVWWCNLGLNIGSEQNGGGPNYERPVLIIKKFSHNTFLCFPMTSKYKRGSYYYNLSKNDTVLLCQPRLIDSKRLTRELREKEISRDSFRDIIKKFQKLLPR